ncbi:hypothetical protein RIF29_16108 [Crotalaria pallida]|uniref:Uncharacterized protein n=1 Tax=Crotalaria pallida TaxID=3830 RepID=A0AAN9ID82_CROPI
MVVEGTNQTGSAQNQGSSDSADNNIPKLSETVKEVQLESTKEVNEIQVEPTANDSMDGKGNLGNYGPWMVVQRRQRKRENVTQTKEQKNHMRAAGGPTTLIRSNNKFEALVDPTNLHVDTSRSTQSDMSTHGPHAKHSPMQADSDMHVQKHETTERQGCDKEEKQRFERVCMDIMTKKQEEMWVQYKQGNYCDDFLGVMGVYNMNKEMEFLKKNHSRNKDADVAMGLEPIIQNKALEGVVTSEKAVVFQGLVSLFNSCKLHF